MPNHEQLITAAGLMPHAPILIPAVGGGREREAAKSVDSMRRISQRLMAGQPERVVLISPHSPRWPGRFGVWPGARLHGTLEPFGCPEVHLDLENDLAFLRSLKLKTEACAVQLQEIPNRSLDHGAIVPLYFMVEAGWQGPTVILGLNYPGEGGLTELGHCISAAVHECGGKTAIIASGDMSHRLKPNAPGGYHPEARLFDETFVSLVRRGRYDMLGRIDPALQEVAGEDVVDSTLVALAAVDGQSAHHEVLSYEGPFGVGYCVALLYEARPSDTPRRPEANSDQKVSASKSTEGGESLPAIARQAVEDHLTGKSPGPVAAPKESYLKQSRPLFVTIRNHLGELRGCKGNLDPRLPNLIEETRAVALSAAFNDGRFLPVGRHEIDHLTYEVSVLHPMERVASTEDLDPSVYGILIRAEDGRQALMLPGVEGLDTVEEQIEATRRKACLGPDEPVTIYRFQVDKFREN